MKKNNLLKVGLVASLIIGIGFYFSKIGQTLKKLEIFIEGIGKLTYKSGSVYLYFNLGVENPNTQPVTVNDLELDIVQDSRKVGRVTKYDANITIAARTRTQIKNIEVKVNLINLATNFINLFTTSSKAQDFIITGFLKASNMTIPVNETITASL
jgi:LEA14-like dessication related protein